MDVIKDRGIHQPSCSALFCLPSLIPAVYHLTFCFCCRNKRSSHWKRCQKPSFFFKTRFLFRGFYVSEPICASLICASLLSGYDEMSTESNYSELPKLLKTLATDEYCANLTMTPNKMSGTAMSAMSMRTPHIHVFLPRSVLAISANREMSTPAPIITTTTKPKTNGIMVLPFSIKRQPYSSTRCGLRIKSSYSVGSTNASTITGAFMSNALISADRYVSSSVATRTGTPK